MPSTEIYLLVSGNYLAVLAPELAQQKPMAVVVVVAVVGNCY